MKSALASACVVGFTALYHLLDIFSSALKPLVLAAMFVGCMEYSVNVVESVLVHLPSLVWHVAKCVGSCHCCRRMCARKVKRRSLAASERAKVTERPPQGSATSQYSSLLQRTGSGLTAYVENNYEEDDIPKEVRKRAMDLFEMNGVGAHGKYFCHRLIATIVTLTIAAFTAGFLSQQLFAALVDTDFSAYETGFHEAVGITLNFIDRLNVTKNSAVSDHLREDLTKWGDSLASTLSSLVSQVVAQSTDVFVETSFFLIYSLMWLLQPMRAQKTVFKIVRTYFILKTGCNLVYAILCYLCMVWLKVELGIVVALFCFALAYIPEVGAIVAIILPVPLLILDSRQKWGDRFFQTLACTGAMLGIKLVCSNVLESLVMGRNKTLAGVVDKDKEFAETHPVIVLFAVVVCGLIWGPIGMLISVPLISLMRFYYARELEANA